MRIGLISDTHIPWEEKQLPPQVLATFQGVDLILHAGDIYSHAVLDDLECIAPVLAALGDDDYPSSDARVQEKHILEFEGIKLWLIHERPYRITPADIEAGKPEIIVFGHEHRTVVEQSDSILYVSSGSPTFLHYKKGLGTVGLLELNAGQVNVQIVQLNGNQSHQSEEQGTLVDEISL